jgi:hypothetical protein
VLAPLLSAWKAPSTKALQISRFYQLSVRDSNRASGLQTHPNTRPNLTPTDRIGMTESNSAILSHVT